MDITTKKGKPITTSVPTFAIRFHTEGEELEELYPYSQDSDAVTADKSDLREEDESSRASTPSSYSVALPQNPLGGSSREISPSKEYPPKLGKRSSSVDSVGAATVGGGSSSNVSDTWNIFHELRGKIAKRVEETLSKSDKSSRKLGTGSKLASGRGSLENSSISDSEDGCVMAVPGEEAIQDESVTSALCEAVDKDDTSVATFFLSEGEADVKLEEASQVEQFPRRMFELRRRKQPHVLAQQGSSETPGTTSPSRSVVSSISCRFTRQEHKVHPEEEDDIDEEFEVLGADSPEEAEEVREETPLIADFDSGVQLSSPTWTLHGSPCNDNSLPDAKLPPPFLSFGWSKPSTLIFFSVFAILPFILPSFLSGILVGICMSVLTGLIIHWWYYGSWLPSSVRSHTTNLEAFAVPDYGKLPILEVPAAKEYQPVPRYEGWMNQYPHEYDPDTYHIGATTSVLVRLEGHILRLSYTRSRVPRRAMWNETPNLRPLICHWRDYNIRGCSILLCPEGLARKRLWSKKYPICIVLKKDSNISLSYGTPEDDEDNVDTDKNEGSGEEELMAEKEAYMKDSDDATDGENSIGSGANYQTLTTEQNNGDDDQWSLSEEETFCPVGGELIKSPKKCLFLFARTDREKDDWFRRFVVAARSRQTPTEDGSITDDFDVEGENKYMMLPDDSYPDLSSYSSWADSNQPIDAEFQKFIGRFLNKVYKFRHHISTSIGPARGLNLPTMVYATESASGTSSPTHSVHGSSKKMTTNDSVEKEDVDKDSVDGIAEDDKDLMSASAVCVSPDTLWANAMLARVLFDVLRDRFWVDKIQERIQRKLSAIKLPYFMEHLLVSELDLGRSIPIIHRASRPIQDERGLWVDLDVTYEGHARMTLETRLNLMRLKKSGGIVSNDVPDRQSPIEKNTSRSPMFDSDMEDSAESSSDEEIKDNKTDESLGTPTSGSSTGKRILRMVDKIAASKYFQQATEYKYIKRAMEGVSNTRLILTVELRGVVGTLALNIPPPPSDRLWYGFRSNPRIWLSARPKLGERQVNISHVTDWIENKLCIELQKIFVLPNMDDLIIPVMSVRLPQ